MELKPQELFKVLQANHKSNGQPQLRRADVQLLGRATALGLKINILQSDWQRVAFKSINRMDSTIDFMTYGDTWMITKESGKWHLVTMSDGKWRCISTHQSPKVLMEKLGFILQP